MIHVHICDAYILLLSLEMRMKRMAVLLTYSSNERTEGEERPLSFFFLTHTHTQCEDKAEAAMVQHASFPLHLLWSTEKTQTTVCVTQYGPRSISSTLSTSLTPPLCLSSALPCLSYIARVHQLSMCFQNIISTSFHLKNNYHIGLEIDKVTL